MRRLILAFLVSSLLVTLAFVQKVNIPAVKASSSVYQGDLILTGNNVTTIEGRFDINGSIIVEDNATLHLKNAFLNFTQTRNRQYNLTLNNPLNGNPRLSAYNSTITSNFQIYTDLEDNSTGIIENSTISCYVHMWGYSSLSVSSSSYAYYIKPLDSSATSIDDSLIGTIESYSLAEVHVNASEINHLHIVPRSINCTISKLEPGLISYWDFINNCSVMVLHDGTTPNVTLANTWVRNLGFAFEGNSDVVIMNSIVWEASASDYSIIHMGSTDCYWASAGLSTVLLITDSSLDTLYVSSSSNTWLLNSTFSTLYKFDSARVYVSWYLNAHVVDSIGQNVPSANVTATYPNATVADSRLTDANGWTRLTLMEKMINATDSYPIGNYTVEATYDIYSDDSTVNMTENKQITLTLEDFIIPEFPSFLILPLFMIATLLAVIVYKRKRQSE